MANDCRVLKLAFRQTKAEEMVRAASTILFNALSKLDYPFVPLSELAQTPQYGFTESACYEEVGPKFVRITDIQDGMINWDTVPYCRCDDPEKYLLSPNDILFARTGATTGKTYLVQQAPYAIFASYLIRLHPNNSIRPEYLYSFFQSNAYWSQVLDEKEGSAQPNVNGKKLLNIKVPMVDSETQILISKFLDSVRSRQDGGNNPFSELPLFLADQRRMVARIEELAARIEEARELRRLAVVETESRLLSANDFSFGFKSNWKVAKVRDICETSQYGYTASATTEEAGPRFLRITDIQDGHVNWETVPFCECDNPEPYLLKSNDILFARTGATTGKSFLILNSPIAIFASYLIRIRVKQLVSAKYLYRYFQTPKYW
jgi:type I restriction enzyme S subunit